MAQALRAFEAECEVWVKPLFRKARPKRFKTTWMADSYETFLHLLQIHYSGKRWQLLSWAELQVNRISNPRMISEEPL